MRAPAAFFRAWSDRRIDAFLQRPLLERIGGPIHELPDVPHLGKQAGIGCPNQHRALLEFRKLRQAFIGGHEYSSPGIIVIIPILYQAQTEQLGYLLHDQLVRMSEFARQIRGGGRAERCKNSHQRTRANRDDDPHRIEDSLGLLSDQDAQPFDSAAKKHGVIDRGRVMRPLRGALSQGAGTAGYYHLGSRVPALSLFRAKHSSGIENRTRLPPRTGRD